MSMSVEENVDDGRSDGSSSAPNSENLYVDDHQPLDVELQALESPQFHGYIPVILHLAPPVIPDGSPVLEVWGQRPFGYSGETVVWTIYRAEPEDDDIPDDESFWAQLGIELNHDAYYRAWLIRPTEETQEEPPLTPGPLDIFYVKAENQVQPVPGALLIKTFLWHPERPRYSFMNDTYPMSHFWLLGCGKVTDRKDLRRIHMKVDVYLNSIKRVACRHGTFDSDEEDAEGGAA